MDDAAMGRQDGGAVARRASFATATGKGEAEIENAALEKQKFRLLQHIARDKKTLHELEHKCSAAESRLLERRQRLGEYNALFMRLDDAATKAPRQRLGATNAVMGTKRIIEKELTRLRAEAAVCAMKLNKAKDANASTRAQVNALRKDAMTFRKLFAAMRDELLQTQVRVEQARAAVNGGYAARDVSQEEMRELAKQFELDKLERQQEWAVFSDAIDKANREGLPQTLELGSGLLSQEEEEALRRKIRKGQSKMAKDRHLLSSAGTKLVAFSAALERIRQATGYQDLRDVVDLFERYEEDKFGKVGAANRLVVEMERGERDVARLRGDVKARDEANERIKSQRAHVLDSTQLQADELGRLAAEAQARVFENLSELRALYRVIEFTLRSLGAPTVIESDAIATGTLRPSSAPGGGARYSHGGGGGGAGDGPDSPLKSRVASLRMYAVSATMATDVSGGISSTSLPQFMSIVEARAADVIQQYVAIVASGNAMMSAAAAVGGDVLSAAAPPGLDASLDATTGTAGDAATVSSPQDAGGAAGTPPQPIIVPRRFISPAALGPSRPTGKLKESLAASALLAALAVDSAKLEVSANEDAAGADGADGGDGGDVRPIPVRELKRQAAAALASDRNVRSVRSAAAVASTVLSKAKETQ